MALTFATSIHASEPLPEIQSCKEKAQPMWDSGVTLSMRKGNGVYGKCLLATIKAKLPEVFDDQAEIEATYTAIETAAQNAASAHYSIYNNNKLCSPRCGTLYTVTYHTGYTKVLEDFLIELQHVPQQN